MQLLYSSYTLAPQTQESNTNQTGNLSFFCLLICKDEFNLLIKVLKVFRINSPSFLKTICQITDFLQVKLIRQSKECASRLPLFFSYCANTLLQSNNGCISPVLGLMLAAMWKCPRAFAWWEMWRWTSWVPCWSGGTSVWVTRTEDLLCPFLIFFKWWIVCCSYKK